MVSDPRVLMAQVPMKMGKYEFGIGDVNLDTIEGSGI